MPIAVHCTCSPAGNRRWKGKDGEEAKHAVILPKAGKTDSFAMLCFMKALAVFLCFGNFYRSPKRKPTGKIPTPAPQDRNSQLEIRHWAHLLGFMDLHVYMLYTYILIHTIINLTHYNVYLFKFIYYMHILTLHYITLHTNIHTHTYIHYITLPYITLHYLTYIHTYIHSYIHT